METHKRQIKKGNYLKKRSSKLRVREKSVIESCREELKKKCYKEELEKDGKR